MQRLEEHWDIMYVSAAPWTAPCGPADSSSLFPGQRGDSVKPGWAAARARAQTGPGQMGQQMGQEAEPPLICSTRNPESGHTQRHEEEGGRHGGVQDDRQRRRYKEADNRRV